MTALVLSCAAAVMLPQISQRRAQHASAMAVVIWNSCMTWSWHSMLNSDHPLPMLSEFGNWFIQDAVIVLLMDAASVGLGPENQVRCMLCHLCNLFIFLAMHYQPDTFQLQEEVFWAGVSLSLVAFALSAFLFRRELRGQLEAAQAVNRQLLDITCDTCFWLAEDGDTVAQADGELNRIMGLQMTGRRVSDSLAEAEKLGFRLAVAGATGSMRVVPVTLPQHGSAGLNAELIVIAPSATVWQGALVGVRLTMGREQTATTAASFTVGWQRSGPTRSHSHSWESAPAHSVRTVPTLPDAATASSSTAGPCALLRASDWEDPKVTLAAQVPSPDEVVLEVTGMGFEGSECEAPLELSSRSFARPMSQVDSLGESCPETLQSQALEPLRVQALSQADAAEALLQATAEGARHLGSTVHEALSLVVNHAKGGALLLIASEAAFSEVFNTSEHGRKNVPSLRTSDGGYMTARLRGIHVTDSHFATAFAEFTEHSESDRWPAEHPEEAARNMPKDGAFLLDTSGFRLKCAAKVLGLPSPIAWPGVGTKHEAALACAWAVKGCVALVRSDAGAIHGIVRSGNALRAYNIRSEDLYRRL